MRNDLQGEIRAPYSVQDYLTRRGGKNPFGEPMYRLVWAPTRVVKQGGRWHDWDSTIPVNERGGVSYHFESDLVIPFQHKPFRIIEEVRETRKYAFDGWVLERWVPSIMYPRYEYEKKIPNTNISFLGPYPENGDYEMCAGGPGQTEIPELSRLDDAIAATEQAKNRHRSSVEQETLQRLNAAQHDYEVQMQKEEVAIREKLRKDRAILFGTSLAAGRVRNELARRAGIREHVGN